MSIAAYVPAPYERRVREGPKPYAGFCVFRDQPPGTRSVASTAKAISKSAKLAYHWSATHDWLARAAAWDREQDRIALQARKDEIERINRMHINIAEQMLQSVEQCCPPWPPKACISTRLQWVQTATKIQRDAAGVSEPDRRMVLAGDPDAPVQHEVSDLMANLPPELILEARDLAIKVAMAKARAAARVRGPTALPRGNFEG